MAQNGPILTQVDPSLQSDDAFETEYLNDDDDDHELDEHCQQFYDALQEVNISLLVEKMRVLDPLLIASIQGQPLFLLFLNSDPVQQKRVEIFNDELSGILPTKIKQSHLIKGRINSSVRDNFFLALQHLIPSSGYSMKRFLKSHPMVLEYLEQNIDRLMPIQRDYITFCSHFRVNPVKSLRRSFTGLEVGGKRCKREPDSLRASK